MRATLLVLLTIGILAVSALGSAYGSLADARLLPVFAFHHGYPLYIHPDSGPVFGAIYTPLATFAYEAVVFFHTPRTAFIAAALLSQLYSFLPLVVLLFLAASPGLYRGDLLLGGTLFVLWCNFSAIMQTVFLVHADPPAICAAALGVVAFLFFLRSGHSGPLIASAVFCSLAPWAKQTIVPVLLVAPIVLTVRKQFRPLAIYCATGAAVNVLMAAISVKLCDWHNMVLWILGIPSKHAWRGLWSTILDEAFRALLFENVAALTILIMLAIVLLRNQDWRAALARPSTIFLLAGLLCAPTAILGYVKVGGTITSFLYPTYFFNLGLVSAMLESMAATPAKQLRIAAWTLVVLLAFPAVIRIGKAAARPAHLLASPNLEAYEFTRQHPGEVYFPFHSSSAYLADGHIYHSELYIEDVLGAGIHLDPARLRANLPAHMKYLAYHGAVPGGMLELLPEFSEKVELPELPGWTVLARKATK